MSLATRRGTHNGTIDAVKKPEKRRISEKPEAKPNVNKAEWRRALHSLQISEGVSTVSVV